MLCSSDSLRVENIPACTAAIVSGTISNLSASLFARFIDNTTGRIYVYDATSDGAGLVTVSISECFPVDHSFTLSIHLATDDELFTKVNVTIGGETGDEILFSFYEAYQADGDNHPVSSATLKLAA